MALEGALRRAERWWHMFQWIGGVLFLLCAAGIGVLAFQRTIPWTIALSLVLAAIAVFVWSLIGRPLRVYSHFMQDATTKRILRTAQGRWLGTEACIWRESMFVLPVRVEIDGREEYFYWDGHQPVPAIEENAQVQMRTTGYHLIAVEAL